MISSISSFEVINVVRFAKSEGRIPDRKSFKCIFVSAAAAAAAISHNDIKTLLANGLSTFSLKANQFLVMVQEVFLEILLTVPS